jgi:uncharacterized membrane protein
MLASLVSVVRALPPEVATLLLSALPLAELRGALPVALLVYHLPLWEAFVLSVVGTMLPVYFLLFLLERVSDYLSRHWELARWFFTWLFEHTRQRFDRRVQRYGYWALLVIAALPLPVLGGAWTAVLVAFVFGLEHQRSFWAIAAGSAAAAFIVLFLTQAGAFVYASGA